MRSQLVQRFRTRNRSGSLSAVPPPKDSGYYLPELQACAARILYRSPLPSKDGLPVYILNAAAFPDTFEFDYDSLLPYVLERLPGEDQLLGGQAYEVVFFAGGQSDGTTTTKKDRPGWAWFIQAYNILPRAMRKRIQKLYIVHERAWVRILVEMFSTIVSPKFRRKIEHVSTLSQLALYIDIQDLLIPPSAYLYDRQYAADIHVPYVTSPRAFCTRNPLPKDASGALRLPRVLRETSAFLLLGNNIRTEGLFRIPPNAKVKEIVREAYDRAQRYIIWKDNDVTLPVPVYAGADESNQILQELDPLDAHGVHLAAALIKLWYAELREPIFPSACYRAFKEQFDRPETEISKEKLAKLLSNTSDFSILLPVSRIILTRHLIPLLAAVVEFREDNKMNADNLAVCIAPALLRGDDPMEDMKVSNVVRKVLAMAIQRWTAGLREACGVDANSFKSDLEPPRLLEDYEDPPETIRNIPGSAAYYEAQQQSGTITMTDNEVHGETIPAAQTMVMAPVLPPRPPSVKPPSDTLTAWSEATSAPKRKPAPPVPVATSETQPPRYSTIIPRDKANVAESPTSYDTTYKRTFDNFKPTEVTPVAEKTGTLPRASESEPQQQVQMPKRKSITVEPPSASETEREVQQTRSVSANHAMLSGIIAGQAAELIKRKPVTKLSADSATVEDSPVSASSDSATQQRAASYSSISDDNKFAKPAWAASSRKPLAVNTLARGIVPSGGDQKQSQSPSLTTPPYALKARTPSPGLLERMPSFGSTKSSSSVTTLNELRVPGRLDMKKPSVEDLRKLYEERTDTAKTLVEAGNEGSRRGFQA